MYCIIFCSYYLRGHRYTATKADIHDHNSFLLMLIESLRKRFNLLEHAHQLISSLSLCRALVRAFQSRKRWRLESCSSSHSLFVQDERTSFVILISRFMSDRSSSNNQRFSCVVPLAFKNRFFLIKLEDLR